MLHQFTEEEKKELHYQRFHHPHPRVQLKMEVVWLYSQGKSHSEVALLSGVCENTARKYLNEYQEEGIEKLKKINFYRPESELDKHRETIEEYFNKHPPMSAKEAGAKIEELTGIKRSDTQIRKFLKRLGLKRLKIGYVPGKADVEAQKEYKEKELEPRLEEAKKGERVVFFVDAAHFVMKPFLGWIWCISRIFIKSPSGRKRWNVLAALNGITKEVITVTNETYITAIQVQELLEKIALQAWTIPVTLVLDNARDQKCDLIKKTANKLGIELLYLPPYSPNLNLIERLWKLVKKECLYGKYYEDFSQFKKAINEFLKEPHLSHKEKMNSLLTLRFQTFSNTQVMTI